MLTGYFPVFELVLEYEHGLGRREFVVISIARSMLAEAN